MMLLRGGRRVVGPVQSLALRTAVVARAQQQPGAFPSVPVAIVSEFQGQRHFSFFSNLLGMSSKRLEKKPEVVETVPKEPRSADEGEVKTAEIISGGRRGQREALAKKKKQDADRIVGGSYPPRGNPLPPKRLREWRHVVENMTIGPKKLNLVAKLIRKLTVPEARLQLQFSKKEVSKVVLLALDEACMLARRTGKIHANDLIVGQCYVGGKIVGHKIDIKARGKTGKITKRVSHLNIILYENPALVKGFQSKMLPPGVYAKKLKLRPVPKAPKMESQAPSGGEVAAA